MKKLFVQAFALLLFFSTASAAKKASAPAPLKVGFSVAITNINDDRISRARAAGIEYIEVAGITNYHKKGLSQEEISASFQKAADILTKHGMKVWSIHMPFSKEGDVAVLDPEKNEQIMQLHKNIVDLVKVFKPQILLMHPSSSLEAGKREAHREMAMKNLVRFNQWAKEIGAIVVVENMLCKTPAEGKEENLCSSLEDMKVFMKMLPKDIFVAIDVNHAYRPEDYIQTFGARVRSLHISDCDKGGKSDCHFLPGKGNLDFTAILTQLNNARYSGVFMYELNEKEYNKDYNFLVNNYMEMYKKAF